MSDAFFDVRPERIAVLQAEARRWEGTPFRARSAACGERGGVDCIRLSLALEHAAGAVPMVQAPAYRIDSGNHLDSSPLLAFLRGRTPGEGSALVARHLEEHGKDELVQAGDVLVLRAGRVEYHLGVATSNEGDFCHVLIGGRVTFSNLQDSTYAGALQTIFRPVATEE